MLTLDKLNTSLKTVKNTINIGELNNSANQSISDFNSLFKAKGKKVGDIVEGFEVVADEGLDLEKDTLSPVVGRISEDVALELKKTSTQKANIATITGLSVDDGFLESAISNTNPLGIDKTLNKISNDTSGITSITQNLSVGTNTSLADALLNNLSAQGVANNFVTDFTNITNSSSDLINFLQTELSENVVSSVTGDTSVKSAIQSNLGSSFKSSLLSDNPVIVNSVGSFNGKLTPDDYEFTFVNTVEELLLEFRNSEREFSQMIIEFTDEFVDDNFDARDFHNLYSSEDFAAYDGIPYHYLMRKDGRIQRGRPLDIETKYLGRISYKNAVLVAIPGGFSVPFGADRPKHTLNSATVSSWYWFNTLLDVAYTMFPGIQVFSSDELEEIGWSADAYIETRFGKRNNERPVSFTSELTRSTLITTEPV